MKRWRYVLRYGLGFITFTWILSGLFSMNPGSWSPGPDASLAEVHSFAGAPLSPSVFKTPPKDAWTILRKCLQLKELELIMFNGESFYIGRASPSDVRLLPAAIDAPSCLTHMPLARLIAGKQKSGRRGFGSIR